jgi:formamidopyrimidine-DNA glycosylase
MPELPEVETVRCSLQPLIVGWTCQSVAILTPGVFVAAEDMNIAGLTIQAIRRRGKYLLFDLTPGNLVMVVHLRMTGQFLYHADTPEIRKHDHVLFHLTRGDQQIWLVYHDTRRFGRIWLLPADELNQIKGLASLGPEPLAEDLTGESLRLYLQRRARTSLKAALLDQTVLAGLGNIYADESLFAAGISPLRLAGSLTPAEADRLAESIKTVLAAAIGCRGTSIRDYVDGLNVRGHFQYQLRVYGRGGQPCVRCGTSLLRRTIAGRTTCSCPVCQPDVPGREPGPPGTQTDPSEIDC